MLKTKKTYSTEINKNTNSNQLKQLEPSLLGCLHHLISPMNPKTLSPPICASRSEALSSSSSPWWLTYRILFSSLPKIAFPPLLMLWKFLTELCPLSIAIIVLSSATTFIHPWVLLLFCVFLIQPPNNLLLHLQNNLLSIYDRDYRLLSLLYFVATNQQTCLHQLLLVVVNPLTSNHSFFKALQTPDSSISTISDHKQSQYIRYTRNQKPESMAL